MKYDIREKVKEEYYFFEEYKKPGRKAVTLPTRLFQLYTELLGANIFRIAKSENQDKDGV